MSKKTLYELPVEVYVGRMDNTWYTTFTTVKTDLSPSVSDIESQAIDQVKESLYREKKETAFVGIYHYSMDDLRELVNE